MNDAVAIALEGVTVRMRGLRIPPPAGSLNGEPEMFKHLFLWKLVHRRLGDLADIGFLAGKLL